MSADHAYLSIYGLNESIESIATVIENALFRANFPDIELAQLKEERRQKLMTQVELASKIGSSQPRIAKAENGDDSVSIELLIRAMLATGATPKDIGQIIASIG